MANDGLRGAGARAYRIWSAEAEEALRQGVHKHGLGAWESIRRDPTYADLLGDRTGVQLKDKWRNLVKFRHIGVEEQKQYRPTGTGPWSDHRNRKYNEAIGSPTPPPSGGGGSSISGGDGADGQDEHVAALLALEMEAGRGSFEPPPRRVQRQAARAAIMRKVWNDTDEGGGDDGSASGLGLTAGAAAAGAAGTFDERLLQLPLGYGGTGLGTGLLDGGGDGDGDGDGGLLTHHGGGGGGGVSAIGDHPELLGSYLQTSSTRSVGRGGKRQRHHILEDRRYGIYDQRRYKVGNGPGPAVHVASRGRNAANRSSGGGGSSTESDMGNGDGGMMDVGDDADPDVGPVDESYEINCCCGTRHDDGEMMIECEMCRVWSHLECLRQQMVALPEAEREINSLYLCMPCRQRKALAAAAPPRPDRDGTAHASHSGDSRSSKERAHEVSSLLLGLANGNGQGWHDPSASGSAASTLPEGGWGRRGRQRLQDLSVPPALRKARKGRARRAPGGTGWGDTTVLEEDPERDERDARARAAAAAQRAEEGGEWDEDLAPGAAPGGGGGGGGGGGDWGYNSALPGSSWDAPEDMHLPPLPAELHMAGHLMSPLPPPMSGDGGGPDGAPAWRPAPLGGSGLARVGLPGQGGLAAPRPMPHPAIQRRTSEDSLRNLAGHAMAGQVVGRGFMMGGEQRPLAPGLVGLPLPRTLVGRRSHTPTLGSNTLRRSLQSQGGGPSGGTTFAGGGSDDEGGAAASAAAGGSLRRMASPRLQQRQQREQRQLDEASALSALELLRSDNRDSSTHGRTGTPSLAQLESLLRATPQPQDMNLPMLLSNSSMAQAALSSGGRPGMPPAAAAAAMGSGAQHYYDGAAAAAAAGGGGWGGGRQSPGSPSQMRKAAARARAIAAAATAAATGGGSVMGRLGGQFAEGGVVAPLVGGAPAGPAGAAGEGLGRSHASAGHMAGHMGEQRPMTPDAWAAMMMRTGTPTPEALALGGFAALPPGDHPLADYSAAPWLLSHTPPPLADLMPSLPDFLPADLMPPRAPGGAHDVKPQQQQPQQLPLMQQQQQQKQDVPPAVPQDKTQGGAEAAALQLSQNSPSKAAAGGAGSPTAAAQSGGVSLDKVEGPMATGVAAAIAQPALASGPKAEEGATPAQGREGAAPSAAAAVQAAPAGPATHAAGATAPALEASATPAVMA